MRTINRPMMGFGATSPISGDFVTIENLEDDTSPK